MYWENEEIDKSLPGESNGYQIPEVETKALFSFRIHPTATDRRWTKRSDCC